MKCFICDAILSEPQFNHDHQDWDPCPKCQEVITDCLNGFKDQVIFYDDSNLEDEL